MQCKGWSPLVALQIEYSLIERTVEGELMPMARELGLGVTPWSPLRGGVLSGKYTRANASTQKSDRGDRVTAYLTEGNYKIIDELIRIAGEHKNDSGGRRAVVGAEPSGRGVDDHRRAPNRAARPEPRGARRTFDGGSGEGARPRLQADAELPGWVSAGRADVLAGRNDRERRDVDEVGELADFGRGSVLNPGAVGVN